MTKRILPVSKPIQVDAIKILGSSQDNKYPFVPLLSIGIADRPEEGNTTREPLFYNARDLESMDSEQMCSLRNSIANTGLHTPLMVRAFTDNHADDGDILRLELIAGERRLRSLLKLVEDNTLVFDWRTKTMLPAREVWTHVPCEIYYNLADEEALTLSWIENYERQSLTVQEEINLVERLCRRGMQQGEIATRLHSNVTWVSQTCAFRRELPPNAFQLLVEGKISRHVAVQLLGLKTVEDRNKVMEQAIIIEHKESEVKRTKAQRAVEHAEDEEEIAKTHSDSPKFKKRVAAAARKVAIAKKTQQRIESESGVIRQGHMQKAALETQVTPRTAKVLTKSMIDQFLVSVPEKWITTERKDPYIKSSYPPQLLKVMIGTAKAVLSGNYDAGGIIRKILVEEGIWVMPEGVEEQPLDLLDISEDDEELPE